ncbi:MAG: type II toxin-antitoxin system death-on-curing family toxin [Anaerolineae bacterium]|nr:type II toxin-antitoxin system death-on-curing family toxin [Anaerolineae bacterium]
MTIRYLTEDELIYINEQLPGNDRIHTIVQGKRKVRDIGLLDAAVGRPQQTVFGEDAYPTLIEKAAALLHAITRNHPFADGNKRTATVALLMMLKVNGYRAIWEPADALKQIVAVAEGQLSLGDFVNWLQIEPGTPRLEPDAEADAGLIADLIAEHRWLLAELVKT